MRLLVAASATVLALLSGCGPCTATCTNTAVLTAIDANGTVLTLQSVSENVTLSPTAGCGTTASVMNGLATVTSSCMKFAVDAVATNGKRFSGIIDVSAGALGPVVCGVVCRSANVNIQVN
jgi:hypothetical protein